MTACTVLLHGGVLWIAVSLQRVSEELSEQSTGWLISFTHERIKVHMHPSTHLHVSA